MWFLPTWFFVLSCWNGTLTSVFLSGTSKFSTNWCTWKIYSNLQSSTSQDKQTRDFIYRYSSFKGQIISSSVLKSGKLYAWIVTLQWWLFTYLIDFYIYHQDIIATGGIDTNAVLFDRSSGQVLCTLTDHSKKVHCQTQTQTQTHWLSPHQFTSTYVNIAYSYAQITSLKFVPRDELLITGSADKVHLQILHSSKVNH